jgi:hypothetical protein
MLIRTGELTRGMLVVDRRSEGLSSLGENRAYAQEKLSRIELPDNQSIPVPAQVEAKEDVGSGAGGGVAVVVQTPGQDVLVELLLKRIWGVDG